ncbi:MAG: 50S ribosomal protein L9 [Ignavibacteria bacterium]|nr:50S ribosomal protein L9 [Ignavibacteria bacterium]
MKVILKQDFEKLGNAGDIKEVKNGYARNFLIPRGIAVAATPANIKSFQEVKRQQERKRKRELENARKTSFEIERDVLEIYAKAGEENKLFGSITAQMIYEKLLEKGYKNIERKKILLHEHIKTLGEHIVEIKLHSDVIAKLKVLVKDEKTLKEKDDNKKEKE